MFTDPMFYEDTEDNLTDEERARKDALAKKPLAYVPTAPAVAKPVDLKEPDPPALEPLGLITDDNPPKASIDTPKWTARDQFNEDIKTEPKLNRPGGVKGALQRIGEIGTKVFLPALSDDIMHPKYSDQMRDYNRKIGQDVDLMRSEEAAAENQRKQAVAERQIAASNANEAAARAREAYTEKQAAELGKPKPQNVISVNAPAIYDPNTKQWSKNPHYQPKAGNWQQKLDAMTEQMQILHPEWEEDQARQAAAAKLQELSDSIIDRNKAGIGASMAGAGNAAARTDLTLDETARRRRDDKVDQDAAKVLADNNGDYDTATNNVMNPQWYGHLGDDKYRASVADALRALKAKRNKKTENLLAKAKGGGSQSAPAGGPAQSGPSFSSPDEKPPEGMVKAIAPGQAVRSPSGQIWEKQKDGSVKRVK